MLKDSIEKSILKHNARVKKGFKPLTLEEAIMVMYFQDKLIEHNGIYVDTLVKDRNLPLGYEQLIKNKSLNICALFTLNTFHNLADCHIRLCDSLKENTHHIIIQ